MNYLNLTRNCFYCSRPAHSSAQAGVQAGPVAEAAGLRTGPDRGAGRGPARGNRPQGRPKPGVRPGSGPRGPVSRPAQAGRQAGRTARRDTDRRRRRQVTGGEERGRGAGGSLTEGGAHPRGPGVARRRWGGRRQRNRPRRTVRPKLTMMSTRASV